MRSFPLTALVLAVPLLALACRGKGGSSSPDAGFADPFDTKRECERYVTRARAASVIAASVAAEAPTADGEKLKVLGTALAKHRTELGTPPYDERAAKHHASMLQNFDQLTRITTDYMALRGGTVKPSPEIEASIKLLPAEAASAKALRAETDRLCR